MDYDLDKFQSVNLVLQYNGNDFLNNSLTEYTNINRFGEIYRLSDRISGAKGNSYSPLLQLSWSMKTRIPGRH